MWKSGGLLRVIRVGRLRVLGVLGVFGVLHVLLGLFRLLVPLEFRRVVRDRHALRQTRLVLLEVRPGQLVDLRVRLIAAELRIVPRLLLPAEPGLRPLLVLLVGRLVLLLLLIRLRLLIGLRLFI